MNIARNSTKKKTSIFDEAVRKLTVWAILPNCSNIRVEKILSEKIEDSEKIIPLAKVFGMEIDSIKKLLDKEIGKIKETDEKNKESIKQNMLSLKDGNHLKVVWVKP